MKRAALLSLVLAAAGGATASAAPPPPRAQLTNFTCRKAQNPAHRDIGVTALMRPVSGTQHMEIEFFVLRELAGSSTFRAVPGAGLGRWLHPPNRTLGQLPGDKWLLDKVVRDLPGTAVYRLRAGFRWLGRHGRVLQRTVRTSSICRAD